MEFYKIDQLKDLSVKEITGKITGSYVSVSMQMGWSKEEPLTGYCIKLTKDKHIFFYRVNKTGKSESYNLLGKYKYELINANGILEIKTVNKTVKSDSNLLTISHDWFKGIFYISTDFSVIRFGNGIEYDAGPATTWSLDNSLLLKENS